MSFGKVIRRLNSCTNSMDWAKSELERVPHGTLFLCDWHESPRGRQGRPWMPDEGQLLLTFTIRSHPSIQFASQITRDERIIKKNCENVNSSRLSRVPDETLVEEGVSRDTNNIIFPSLNMALTLGFLAPLRQYNIGLKWPNDFVHNNRKVAGMLIEVVWQGNELKGVVVGFGLNVNNAFNQTSPLYGKAISLKEITGKTFDLAVLQDEICAGLNEYYDQFTQNGFESIYSQWRAAQAYLGKTITVHTKEGQLLSGTMEDVLPNGDMVLVNSGEKHVLNLHDVFEIRP